MPITRHDFSSEMFEGEHRSRRELMKNLGHAQQFKILRVVPQRFQRLCFVREIDLLPQLEAKSAIAVL